ncbi:MLP-like protein 28 [Melia azedarach]|uniref:MLP-like protein 28 n=1 Tax=Melia azedarach TaxID=155640 RepID=A0ACC1XGV2_MELAZ|nr:MLP-like protein 28 [Melia azedarach]
MALTGKLETQIEIKTPAEKFYKTWKAQCHNLPNATPDNMHAVEVHHGDWESDGSIKVWNYSVGGRKETYKEIIETNDETRSVALVGLEGDVFKHYKSWKPIITATPKADGSGSVLTLTLEYEKLNEDVPVPHEYLDFMVRINKDLGEYLVSN